MLTATARCQKGTHMNKTSSPFTNTHMALYLTIALTNYDIKAYHRQPATTSSCRFSECDGSEILIRVFVYFPAFEHGLDDFEAVIHPDVASLKARAEQRKCRLCVVLYGMFDHRTRFGPSERQSSGLHGKYPKICLSLHFGGYEESDEWDILEEERHIEDTPKDIVFSHLLGTDEICIRNPQVIARSTWHADETGGSNPSPTADDVEASPDPKSTNTSTGSDQTLALARRWIGNCSKMHETCEKPNGVVHLINSGERISDVSVMQYVTLSHRWNPTYNCFTLTSNIHEHETQGIEMTRLPKTFAEACVTVKKLGLNYLWIDSLCIIQDSNADKALEIPNMADNYQNAALNLSASTQSIAGLWSDRDGEATKPFKINATLDLLGERIFPRRTLFFDSYWISFECSQMSASESCPDGMDLTASSNPVTVESVMGTQLDRDCSLTIIGGKIRTIDAMSHTNGLAQHSATRRQMLTLWYRILNEYSLRQLSFESDRLDAISGLAERLSRITGDEYIGGMWRSSLLECLQWRTNTQNRGKEAIRQTRHRAPTWSWASCELLPRSGSKRLLVTNDYATRSKSLTAIRILGVMWQCEGANRFGSLSEASLTIMGRPLRGFAYSGGKAPVFEEEWVTMDEDIEELPALKPSRAEGRQASQTQCFVVVRGETDSGERAEMVSQVIPDTSDQKVEGYVHLLPVAESWVVGGGDRLFCLVLREASPGVSSASGRRCLGPVT
ncbi:hypothetical protein LA080_000293 [Diaporthe eres]|nr:hypothetical protein LA080_000293 [Diaporthe eres]